VCKDTIFCIVL